MMRNKKQIEKAFTLVELIIVITILSILATIGFISFQNYTKDTRDSIRATDLKTIYQGLQLYKINADKFPNPEEYIEITGVSNQGYAKETISRLIKSNKEIKDPLNKSYYTYTTNKDNTKIQLMTFLESGNNILLTKSEILPKAYSAGEDKNTSKLTYTYGDKIGILIEEETKKPVQEIYTELVLDLTTNTGTYEVIFPVTENNSGSITGSGEELLRTINIIQNSCLLGEKIINDGDSVRGYNAQTVGFGEKCLGVQRECNDGVLTGNSSYKYDSCIVLSGANCTNNEPYNGYEIQDINHDETIDVTKIINLGQSVMKVSCFNGKITYGNETINCGEYVYDDTTKTCNENLCNGTKPINSQLNGNEKYNTNWVYNTQEGDCHFICKDGYHWENNSCVESNYIFTQTISTHTLNYNLKNAAILAGWNQVSPLIATITINGGVYVGSSSTSAYAFDTGTGFPIGSKFTIINNGYISGRGGNGGNYGPNNGGAGGPGLIARIPISITNNGIIQGGGGGGGAGQSPWGGGGGGAGYPGGSGGIGGGYDDGMGPNGRVGTISAGGIGGYYYGGSGGGPGSNGGNSPTTGVGYGGAGGVAVTGNSNITWQNAGTRYGAVQ